jgi:hypothetical protein
VQRVVFGDGGITVDLGYDEQIQLYRQQCASGKMAFVDSTANIVADWKPLDADPVRIYCTTIQVQSPGVASRNTHPQRCLTILATDAQAFTLVESLRAWIRREEEIFGDHLAPYAWGMDCGRNLLNAFLLVYNDCTHESYTAKLWELAEGNCDLLAELRKINWSLVTWCLYHVNRAVREYAERELRKGMLTKEELVALATGLFYHMRVAPSAASLKERQADVIAILCTDVLKDLQSKLIDKSLVHLENAILSLIMHQGGSAIVKTGLPGNLFIPSFETCPEDVKSPFFQPALADYFKKQWIANSVYWAEAFVESRSNKTDQISEVAINFLKTHLLGGKGSGGEAGKIRIDVFCHKDAQYTRGSISRYSDDTRKLISTKGVKMTIAAGLSRDGLAGLIKGDAANLHEKEGWDKNHVGKEMREVADLVADAIKKIKEESPASRVVTQTIICTWLTTYAFGSWADLKDPGFTNSKWFNNTSNLSNFLRKKRNLCSAAVPVIKRWALAVQAGEEAPHLAKAESPL